MPSDSLPAQLFRTGRFTHGVPGQFTVAPDGATVLYLRTGRHPRLVVQRLARRVRRTAPARRLHAAVAEAGVTDQRLYGAHWRERFLGHPDEHPERYRRNSLLLAAPRLTRPLLLIHGLCDTNVHPANTLRLSEALLHADRPHEVLLLPGTGHRAIGGPLTEPLLNHQADFLRRHLKTP